MVRDSRPTDEHVNRRRECQVCGHRFSTIEVDLDLFKRMDPPDREKVRDAIDANLLELKSRLHKIFRV